MRRVPLIVCVLLLVALGAAGQDAGKPGLPVQVQMRNIRYHFTERVDVGIANLRGELAPTGPLPIFDDKQSFHLRIFTGEISISAASLENVLNTYVLAAHDAPLKNISISIEHDRLKVKGNLHHQGDVPFETTGTLAATPDGKLRLHTEKVKALKLPVKGLMDLLGVEIADLVKSGKTPGLQADGDDLFLDPQQLLPPPHIEGKVAAVRLQGNDVVLTFGGEKREPLAVPYPSYMAYRGNFLRFGKLAMHDTDMILIDMDPKDPFDFSLDRYREMLSAGYTKITPQFGLRVYMRDLNKLPRPSRKK
jgi:hypothetical protein